MRINRLKLPIGEIEVPRKLPVRKKTTHCTPVEILGRIDEVLERVPTTDLFDSTKAERYQEIVDLMLEWKHS
jgi:hypothetical protein